MRTSATEKMIENSTVNTAPAVLDSSATIERVKTMAGSLFASPARPSSAGGADPWLYSRPSRRAACAGRMCRGAARPPKRMESETSMDFSTRTAAADAVKADCVASACLPKAS